MALLTLKVWVDGVHHRALDLHEELEEVLGDWRAYCAATVFPCLFLNLFNGR